MYCRAVPVRQTQHTNNQRQAPPPLREATTGFPQKLTRKEGRGRLGISGVDATDSVVGVGNTVDQVLHSPKC